jgi:hypothetical protein
MKAMVRVTASKTVGLLLALLFVVSVAVQVSAANRAKPRSRLDELRRQYMPNKTTFEKMRELLKTELAEVNEFDSSKRRLTVGQGYQNGLVAFYSYLPDLDGKYIDLWYLEEWSCDTPGECWMTLFVFTKTTIYVSRYLVNIGLDDKYFEGVLVPKSDPRKTERQDLLQASAEAWKILSVLTND